MKTITILAAILLTAATAFTAPPTGWIDVHQQNCPEPPWFEWVETTTWTWEPPAADYDMELRVLRGNEWIRWASVPSIRGSMSSADISLHPDETFAFFLADRITHETTQQDWGTVVATSCSFIPPPNGSAYVWRDGAWRLLHVWAW